MGIFTSFQNILPDPNNLLSDAGSASTNEPGASAGPGFASVKFSVNQPVMMSRTNSGRVVTRSIAAHSWNIAIAYNPLTRAEFEPVFAFLVAQGKINPFLVELPQYLTAQDSTFASSVLTNDVTIVEGDVPAGRTYFQVGYSGNGEPRQGDIFTITDANNSNHTKAYQVTRVETPANYNYTFDSTSITKAVTQGSAGGTAFLLPNAASSGVQVGDVVTGTNITRPTNSQATLIQIVGNNLALSHGQPNFNGGAGTFTFTRSSTKPNSNQYRLHFSPPLVSATSNSSVLDFSEPRIRVIQKGEVSAYDLGVNGLYKFGLNLEEAAP